MNILTDPDCLQMLGLFGLAMVIGGFAVNGLFCLLDAFDRRREEQSNG